jgi:hypothetical protein
MQKSFMWCTYDASPSRLHFLLLSCASRSSYITHATMQFIRNFPWSLQQLIKRKWPVLVCSSKFQTLSIPSPKLDGDKPNLVRRAETQEHEKWIDRVPLHCLTCVHSLVWKDIHDLGMMSEFSVLAISLLRPVQSQRHNGNRNQQARHACIFQTNIRSNLFVLCDFVQIRMLASIPVWNSDPLFSLHPNHFLLVWSQRTTLHRYGIRIRRYWYGDTSIRHFQKIRIRRYGKYI